MKTLFMLINHALTPEQEEDARKNLNIDKFVNITDARWSDIDPSEKSVIKFVEAYKDKLKKQANMGLIAVDATTNRIVSEQVENGKVVIKREFKHARFREYEEL